MNGDIIRLCFPARPDYILAVRLAVSAIAERIGFDIEDIEDLKVAGAEACILLLAASPELIDICITVQDGLSLEFAASGEAQNEQEDLSENLSQHLLDALVDVCEFGTHGGVIKTVRIEKRLKS